MTVIHSVNHQDVIAGAATLTLEILEQEPNINALVLGIRNIADDVDSSIVPPVYAAQILLINQSSF